MATPAENALEFRLFAMRRTGHHAIIDWITAQLGTSRWCHVNDPPVDGRPVFADTQNIKGNSAVPREVLICNLEERAIADALATPLMQRHDELLGRSDRVVNIIVMRDLFNLSASRLGMLRKGEFVFAMRPDLYADHGREFLRVDPLLPEPFVAVDFNRWAASKTYRGALAAQLGLNFTDAGRQHVAHLGSTFDGIRFEGRADSMPVGERWKQVQNDPEFLAWVRNPTALGYSTLIFGHLPGTERLCPGFVEPSPAGLVDRLKAWWAPARGETS